MANSSASSINHPKSSRFSTLNVFKFSKSKPSSELPPPLPPKDTYYLQNRSLASLSPDSRSFPPPSPLSPNSQYSRRPDMNQSTMSLVSSAASAVSYSPADQPGEGRKKKGKAASFFKFGKRSPKSPPTASSSPSDTVPPPLPEGDGGISLPWNFQHNIHVDEGYTGLPPSWTMSLTQAGFTEEEIADIQNRRAAGTRSPGSQYLFTDRPASPAYTQNNPPPIIKNPTPRSTSLPRQFSDASLSSATQRQQRSPQHHQITTLVTSPSNGSLKSNRTPPRRQYSADQSSTHQSSSSISMSYDSHHSSNSSPSQDSASRTLGAVSPPPAAEPFQPSTPPRRMYHVANELPTIHSPPPSYSHFSPTHNGNGYPVDSKYDYKRDQPTSSTNSTPRSDSTHKNTGPVSPSDVARQSANHSRPGIGSTDDEDSPSSSASTSPSKTTPRPRAGSLSKRLTALPPRLSLHKANDSTDLSTWGEALLSGMSTVSANATPSTSTFAAAQDARLASSSQGKTYGSGHIDTSYNSLPEASTSTSRRQPPPTRPIPTLKNGRPTIELHSSFDSDEGEGEEAPSSAWAEPSTTARYDPSGSWDEDEDPEPATSATDAASPLWSALKGVVSDDITREDEIYNAALNDALSPTIPFEPHDGLEAMIKGGQARPREDGHEGFLTADRDRTNRDSSRSSTSTVTELTKHPAIVRNASVARRAGAYVIDKTKVTNFQQTREEEHSAAGARPAAPRASPPAVSGAHPPSPLSSNFGSEEGSASGSNSSSSLSQDHQTPTTDAGQDSPLLYYLDSSPSPDPSKVSFSPAAHHHMLVSTTDTFGGVHKEDQRRMGGIDEDEEEETEEDEGSISVSRPTIVVSGVSSHSPTTAITASLTPNSPLSPYQRYRGWLSSVVAPLEDFIDEAVDPRDYYEDLLEIAEGESGSVYAATLIGENVHKLKLPPLVKAKDINSLAKGEQVRVAIKSVAIMPSGSPKLVDLQRELSLMRGLGHDNILSMDGVYVDLVEDSLWIRMELMERSLADMIGLVENGLMLHDRTIARFASDTLEALEYLQQHRIAHRDVRSDNLLLNGDGVLKLTDFSNAVQVTRESPMRSEPAGVLYWQAPEIRTPPYNALQVDVWSLGATIWEMAEAEPPFAETQQISDRWPPLTRPETYSPGFHDFLRRCSEPAASRPSPSDLRKTPFIQNACGRLVIRQLLAQCMAIERLLQQGDEDSQGPISE